MTLKTFARAVFAFSGIALLACDEGTPVAPQGMVLQISAAPTRIARTGTSNITMQALRSNGNPVNPGTEIRLSSTIGTVDPVVYTDTDGIARAVLTGDGRAGIATVSAYSGANDPVTTEIEVGARAAAISLNADPSNLPQEGGVVELIALVRDDEGQPLPGASVNFRTEAGSLRSGGRFITTDSRGQARDVLTVSASDTQSEPDRLITVTVEAGGEGGVVTDSIDISIQAPPIAAFTFFVSGNTVTFTDTSSGNPTSWNWNFGDGQSSNERSPVHLYTLPNSYIVRLRVSNAFGSSEASAVVNILP